MKYVNFLLITLLFSVSSFAQGKSQGKGKQKVKQNTETHQSGEEVTKNKTYKKSSKNTGSQKGYSKNQPKKVTASLLRDYPGATNVTWDKYKGDYTATFNSGVWRRTAVYHANGERRDTRTDLTRNQLPGTIWDRVFKRDNVSPKQYTQIERPSNAEKIFRVLSTNNDAYYYDQNGNRVNYDY